MKLEIEHLKYYPNGLGLLDTTDAFMTLEGFDFVHNQVIAERINWELKDIRLVLRPMSDLLKEEFKYILDGFFVPHRKEVVEILKYDKWRNHTHNLLPYMVVDSLFKNHFDVFDLIKYGLAVPRKR